MAKITSEQSREIYQLATSTDPKMSNVQIGKKFGISERAVRYHIMKWERELHTIARTNGKLAGALTNHVVDMHSEAMSILKAVKAGIQEAKEAGVSPEKLAPLYNNWIKSLELASELVGKIVIKREVEATWLSQMEEEERRAAGVDLSDEILKDPEAADLACKLFERITINQEKHGKIQRAPDLKDIEKTI